MQKFDAREWVSSLESILDKKLHKWKKHDLVQNGECVQLQWQFEQTHIHLNIFWEEKKELVSLNYISPRGNHNFMWHWLDDKTIDKVMDRVGNLAQITMYPHAEPPD